MAMNSLKKKDEKDAAALTLEREILASQLLETFEMIISRDWDDLAYLATLLTLPSEQYLSSLTKVINPDGIHHARQVVQHQLAVLLQKHLLC